MNWPSLAGALLAGAFLAPSLPAAASPADVASLRETSRAFVEISRALTPSVVNVKTFRRTVESRFTSEDRDRLLGPFGDFFGPEFRRFFAPPRRSGKEQLVQTGLGSGVIVRPEGIVLTNNHVIRDADVIRVTLADKRELAAELVGTDPRTDIAVLRLPKGTYAAASLGDSDRLEVGDWAIAIGNPFGLGQSVTVGVISAKGRADVGIAELEDFIQTDAAINPGNSGGPLIDLDGRVVGINSAIFSRSGGYQGIGFAVPVNMARAVMEGLLRTGRIVRADLGVKAEPAEGAYAGKGVVVAELISGGGAAEAGLAKGDVILKAGERETPNLESFYRAVTLLPVGREVPVTVARGGKERTVAVMVGDLPARPQSSPNTLRAAPGFSVEELTEDYAEKLGYRYEKGALVVRVERGNAADRAGLEPGDLITAVNGDATGDLESFRKRFEALDWGRKVTLQIRRAGKTAQVVMVLRREE